ncbi:YebC/PmpR family DNA-binding transcriptional regulator [Verrucomicrobium sp. BvORR106]|uniref:YebC/PmpR family DNA-binding transcriptional regulator n=1 Tax=Verrucomicrobium sp. BvORR106 TaxID=1403819 RepID=UPI00056FA236|nr:YebC/PmpR family DNA-binding transcriptional regulator [Verrucomicrobium sp. BvORR106]
MAGHNKWSKVKHIKAVVDAKRGKVFSKFSKELTLAAKLGGSNPELNARLRTAILNARAMNMPGDNIERAIKKGAGELGGVSLEEIVYEGYGQGGVAMLIEVVTDNRNRAVADIRLIMSKLGGTFADAGSVSYLFQRRGEIRLDKGALTEDAAMELALESGGEDMVDGEDDWVIYTAQDQLFAVGGALQAKGVSPRSQQLVYQPSTTVTLTDVTTARAFLKLYDQLDDYDDTQHVHANFEIADDVAAQLSE